MALLKNSTDAAVKLPGMMTAGGFAGHGVYPPATHPAAYCEPIYPHPYSQQFTGIKIIHCSPHSIHTVG